MSIKFSDKSELIIGSATIPENVTFRFSDILKLGGGGVEPTWKDIIISGNTALTLVNAKEDSLNYFKFFGGTELKSILPKGYTQVEYLNNNSTAWLDLGMPIGSSDVLTFDIAWNSFELAPFFGAYNSGGSHSTQSFIGTYANTSNTLCFYASSIDTGTGPIGSYSPKPTVRAILKWNGIDAKPTLDGNEIGTKYPPYDNFTPNVNAYLFTRNQGGVAGNIDDITLYGFKVERNGVLIQNLIPCRRNSDNVLGMYDTVSGTFLTNQGTGTFTAGGNAVPTPDIPMDIVCNNGVLTFGAGNTYNTADGQGTFVTPSAQATTRIYKSFGQLKAGKYKVKITGDFEFIFQYKDDLSIAPTNYGNIGTWATEGVYEITDTSLYYGVAIRNAGGSGSIYPSNFNNIGSIGYTYLGVTPVGTVETVEITGKNLFDSTPYKTGYYIDANGQEQAAVQLQDEYIIHQAIVQPSTTYTISFVGTIANYTQRFHAYDKNGDWILQIMSRAVSAGETVTYTFTTPANCKYIRQGGRSQSNYQIELGSTATEYVPYFNGGSATAEMLLKVGTYQDEQSVLDGQVTREVGIYAFDGTENWIDYTPEYNVFSVVISDAKGQSNWTTRGAYLTHLDFYVGSGTPGASASPINTAWFNSAGALRCKTNSSFNTLNAWTNFLATQYNNGTPMILVYPLKTATTETVTAQPLTIQEGTNVVEITQASIDNLGLEVSYKGTV